MKRRGRLAVVMVLVLALVFGGTMTAFGAVTVTAITASAATPIKVMYDGKYIAFTDASPKIIDSRTMVPFRQILEEMGTVVTFDNGTKTVLAKKGDLEFSFVIGESDIAIKQNGIASVKKMDVVPYLDRKTNRTYVSARFMAETLGYGVGWDSAAKIVVISDYEKLFANADTDFSILNKLLSTDLDMGKTYRTIGSFDVDVKVPATPGSETALPMEIGMTGEISGIQLKTDADMVMKLMVDAEKAIAQMPADQQASARAGLDTFKNMTIKMKMNGTSGVMYMNTNLFSTLDPTIDQNTWVKMDLFKTYQDMGIDMKNMMTLGTEKTSISKMMTQYGQAMQTADANTYAQIKAGYAFFRNLMGDQAFKKTTSGATTTYTLDMSAATVAAAIAKTALTEGGTMSVSDLAELTSLIDQANFSGELVINEQANKMTSYSMNGKFDAQGTSGSFAIKGTQLDVDITMSMAMTGLMEMSMTMTSSMKETTDKVDLTLPAGAKIVDYNTLMNKQGMPTL